MGAGHLHPLTLPGPSALHDLRAHTKVVAALLFVLAVVTTPREAFWAHGVQVAVLLVLARLGRVPLGLLLRRLRLELPFLGFALLLPFVARGPRIEVLGLSLSNDGLWAAWNVLAKGTLGLAASVILVATTTSVDVLRGIERLRVPPIFTAIASFMLRYVEVIAAELRRVQMARVSRGDDPRWIWQARAMASTIGALFVRTFERGERVHLAMVARGYTGTMPGTGEPAASAAEWAVVLAVPAAAATVSAVAWGVVG